jgi:hypothetical protein
MNDKTHYSTCLVSGQEFDGGNGRIEIAFDAFQEINFFLWSQEVDRVLRRHHDRVGQLVAEQPSLKYRN